MASMLDDFFGTSPANPMAPFIDTDPADQERQRFADPLNVGGLIPAAPATAYKPIFRYDNPAQTDWDFDGSKTVEVGRTLGTGWDADYVAELQLPGGKVVSRDEILAQEGGRALLDLMSRKRKGRRGFVESLTQGSWLDFVPYAGDIASLGISIRNMSKVRDTMRKIEEQGGVDKLSTQELVFAKLYTEDMERQANSTWGGKVGGIVRMAPAFAVEFMTSGLLFKAATKGAKALGLVAREGTERFVKRAATTAAVSRLRAARVATGAMAPLTEDAMGEIAEQVTKDTMQTGVMRAFAKAGQEAAKDALEKTAAGLSRQQVYEAAFSAVKAADTAMNTPGGLRSFGRFMSEYTSRGLLEHGHSVLRETSPGIMYKLRNAAGVAFVEAPVRGGLYAAFDFYGINPLIGKLAGADETITKQELQFSLSNDPQTRSMAKWLAFGAAWAEYASENAGGAIDDVFDIAKDLAKVTGRSVAKGALAAKGPVSGVTEVQKGSFMRRLLDQMMGSEDDLIKGVSDVRAAAQKLAHEAGEELGKKHLRQAAHDLKYKSFASFVIADKASRLGITPQAVARTFENMGYDGILGEFMEERYSGFLQGLFGLDEKPSRPFLERLAAAWDQAIPDSTSDAFAEIVAFALPAGVRTASAMAYRGLGGTVMDRAHNFGRAYTELADAVNNGLVAEEAGEVKGVTQIKTSEEGTGSITEDTRKNTTRAGGYEGRLASQGQLADDLAEIAIGARPMAEPGSRRGLVNRAAGFLINAVNAAVSGNPLMMFNDPVNALMQEELGNLGRVMRHEADISFKSIYKKVAQSLAAKRDPAKPFDAAKEHEAIMAEVRPILRKVTGGIVKTALKSRGVLTADAAEIDAFIDTLPKAPDNKINGMEREDFAKEFKEQLREAAAGRMRADVINDSVRFTYQRAPTTSVSVAVKEMERFIAKNLGVATHVDTTDQTYTPAED
ncbi:MAG: hypothetical protein FJ279_00490, partial [Planctomycetes bacterium]|nr:hypothetical protein [Planctomycetota bacterium]